MKQLGELVVADYMTRQAIVVDDTARLTQAVALMDKNRLSVLPVVDEQNEVVGIITTTDLIETTHEIQADLSALSHVNDDTRQFLVQMLADQGDNTLVRDIMTKPVDTVDPDTNMVVAARKLVDHGYHHLPVVDSHGKVAGIVTAYDFVRAFADYGALLAG